jgi:hypothetical protein
MNRRLIVLIAAMGLAGQACAQGRPDGVTESTDPARAAAVERAAREIQQRAAQRAASGQAATSAAIVQGTTDNGVEFLSGGITVEDRVTMHAQRQRYSLWIATVAKPSGAYLSDARLKILRLPARTVVVERTMDGPWFMAALAAGRYEVVVSYKADGAEATQTLMQRVGVTARAQRQAVFRFDSTAEVSPDMQSPFKGNPFGGPGS